MKPDAAPPRLSTLRVPGVPSPGVLAAEAGVWWRLARQGREAALPTSGNPLEEYKALCEFMRLYTTLRFYQLALLLGTTGSIVTALASNAVRRNVMGIEMLKVAAVVLT